MMLYEMIAPVTETYAVFMGKGPDGQPDFGRMTPAQRLAYHTARLDQMFR